MHDYIVNTCLQYPCVVSHTSNATLVELFVFVYVYCIDTNDLVNESHLHDNDVPSINDSLSFSSFSLIPLLFNNNTKLPYYCPVYVQINRSFNNNST